MLHEFFQCLFRAPVHFLTGLFDFLLLCCMGSWCILDINTVLYVVSKYSMDSFHSRAEAFQSL